jgi:AhpD family alkylhydroperoxidase
LAPTCSAASGAESWTNHRPASNIEYRGKMDRTPYPERYDRLQRMLGRLRRAIPAEMAGFTALHEAATVDHALAAEVRELIALGIAIAARCEGCIAFHVHDALEAGATEAQVRDAIGVAVMMGGGPGAIYGAEAIEALDQLLAAAG